MRKPVRHSVWLVAVLSALGCTQEMVRPEPPRVTAVTEVAPVDENPEIVAVGAGAVLGVEGFGFVPRLTDLAGEPRMLPFTAVFVAADGSEVPLGTVSVSSPTYLEVAVPTDAALPTTWVDGTVRIDPGDGTAGRAGGTIRLSNLPTPKLTSARIAGGSSETSTDRRTVFAYCETATAPSATPRSVAVEVGGTDLAEVAGAPARITLIGAGTTAAAAATLVGGTQASATFDAGLPFGSYDVRFLAPDGQYATLASAVTVAALALPCPPPLQVVSVTPGGPVTAPETGVSPEAVLVVAFDAPIRTGNPLSDYLTVTAAAGYAVPFTLAVAADARSVAVYAQDPSASTTRWRSGETYYVQLRAGRGGWERADATELSGWLTAPVAAAFVPAAIVPPVVSSVQPTALYRGEDALVRVKGGGFQPGVQLELVSGAVRVPLAFPLYLSDGNVSGYFRADTTLAPGFYDLVVTNLDGGSVRFPAALYVSDRPVPRIASVAPEAVAAGDAFTLTLAGSDFAFPFTVEVVTRLADGTLVRATAAATSYVGPTTLTADFPGGLADDGSYVVRLHTEMAVGVTLVSEYAAFVVYPPSGNLPQPVLLGTRLKVPRLAAAGTAARDALGNRFLYVIGGQRSVSGPAEPDVEIFAIGPFGEILGQDRQPGRQGEIPPRHSFALVPHGGFLYAIGGVTDASGWPAPMARGATSEVLRAAILDPRDVPEVEALVAAPGAGTLPAGNWSYRVAAVLPATDPVNPGGETLASPSVGVYLAAAGGVEVRWRPRSGATAYRLYRTPTTLDAPGNEAMITEVAAATVCQSGRCSYLDPGLATSDEQPEPLPAGALGNWHAAGVTLDVPLAEMGYALVTTGGRSYLYLIGGSGPSGVTGRYRYAELLPDGRLGPFAVTDYLEDDTVASPVTLPVAAPVVLRVDATNDSNLSGDTTYVLATLGHGPDGTLSDATNRARATTTGTLSAFCTSTSGGASDPTRCTGLSVPTADGGSGILVGDVMALIGGYTGVVDGSVDPGLVTDRISDCKVDTKPSRIGDVDFQNCNNSGVALNQARTRFVHVRVNGLNYILGGYGSTDAVLDTIEFFVR